MNKNGKNNLDIPVLVEPINDPPFIDLPPFVIIDQGSEEVSIFTRDRNKSAVFVGDPDLLHYPGNASRFLVMFSVEVSSGFLSTRLPAKLISTTELKLKTSYQWQPLQTFVTISEHFMVKAKGIRFRGTLEDCNSVLEQLLYHGDEHGAILIVTVNDMGNYGCYPDCTDLMSMPHLVEASVSLMRERPLSSLFVHVFGSAIIAEFILVLSLGVILLFFICKCAFVLINERRRQTSQDFELSEVQNSQEGTLTKDLSDKMTRARECCSDSFVSSLQLSKLHLRSCLELGIGGCPQTSNTPSTSSDMLEMTSPSGLIPSASAKDKSKLEEPQVL